MKNSNNLRKTFLLSTFMAVISSGAFVEAQADIYEFSYAEGDAVFTLLDPTGNSLVNSDSQDWYGYRSNIDGSVTINTDNNTGSMVINTSDFFGGGPIVIHNFGMQSASGSLWLANMYMDWNGNNNLVAQAVLDMSGLLGALPSINVDAVLDASYCAGVAGDPAKACALPASDGITLNIPPDIQIPLPIGPTPVATSSYNVAGATGATTTLGQLSLGVDDGIGGAPFDNGPFPNFSSNFDFIKLTLDQYTDTTAPIVSLSSSSVIINQGDVFDKDAPTGTTVSCTDNHDTGAALTVTSVSDVNTGIVGSYTVSYTCTDSASLTHSITGYPVAADNVSIPVVLNVSVVVDTDGDGMHDDIDPDDDNDGMPDAFEALYGLDPLDAADAALDLDGDSYSNLAEFRAGTNPNNNTVHPGTVSNLHYKILANDGAVNDWLGNSVSISGDTALVASWWDDDNGADSGSVYVYVRDVQGNWLQQAKLTASDGAAADRFGNSVSISGNTALIGSLYDDDNGSFSGSAYIFVNDGAGNWSQQAKLVASDTAAGDQFGHSVSISDNTVLVSAPEDDDNGSASGSAYVFVRNAGVWSQQAKLTAGDGVMNDWFGSSVSVSGNTTLVGALYDDDNGSSSGSAYVFINDGAGNWSQQAKLLASDGAADDQFGNSVSISGDTVLVGAHLDDDNGTNSGSAYLFVRNAGVWSQQTKLMASDAIGNARFGYGVSISSDMAIVGARLDENTGSAYVFVRNAGVWSQQSKLNASDGASNDQFGTSVSISGNTALVGSWMDDDNGSDSGSAYIFSFDDTDDDGVSDIADNCPITPNPAQTDTDTDGIGDACDFNSTPIAMGVLVTVGNGIGGGIGGPDSWLDNDVPQFEYFISTYDGVGVINDTLGEYNGITGVFDESPEVSTDLYLKADGTWANDSETTVDVADDGTGAAVLSGRDATSAILRTEKLSAEYVDIEGQSIANYLDENWQAVMQNPAAVFSAGAKLVWLTSTPQLDSYELWFDDWCEGNPEWATLNNNCNAVLRANDGVYVTALNDIVVATPWVNPVDGSAPLSANIEWNESDNTTLLLELVDDGATKTANYYIQDSNAGTVTYSVSGSWTRETINTVEMIKFSIPYSLMSAFPDELEGIEDLNKFMVVQNGFVRKGLAYKNAQSSIWSPALNGIALDQILANFADTAAPTVVSNEIGSVTAAGSSVAISSALLSFSDGQQAPASITYTVTSGPANGRLQLTTNPGVAITSFTQEDINNSLVTYVHDGSGTFTDNFTFDVGDGLGNTSSGNTFSLNIAGTPIAVDVLLDIDQGAGLGSGWSYSDDNNLIQYEGELAFYDSINSPGQLLQNVGLFNYSTGVFDITPDVFTDLYLRSDGTWQSITSTAIDELNNGSGVMTITDRDASSAALWTSTLSAEYIDISGDLIADYMDAEWQAAMINPAAVFGAGAQAIKLTPTTSVADAYELWVGDWCAENPEWTTLNNNCNAIWEIASGAWATTLDDLIEPTAWVNPDDGSAPLTFEIVWNNSNGTNLTLELVDDGATKTANYYVTGAGTTTLVDSGLWARETVNTVDMIKYVIPDSLMPYFPDELESAEEMKQFLTVQNGFVRRGLFLEVGDSDNSGDDLNGIAVNQIIANLAPPVPVITNLAGNALNYTMDDGAVVIEQAADAVVTDPDSADFDTATLTVSFVSGSDSAEDVLAIRDEGTAAGKIGISGVNILQYGGVNIGAITGGTGGADLVVILGPINPADASIAAVSALIKNITYENTDTVAATEGVRNLRFVLTDGDGSRSIDNDVTVTVATAVDTDLDGVLDPVDNCPTISNPAQIDTDVDGLGNACDSDDDGDGVPDVSDALPLDATESVDTDGDGIGNNADTDDDNDTIPDALDQSSSRDPLVADWVVSTGDQHTCVLDDSGVVCWGRNDYGQTTVPALTNPLTVSAGDWHTCALDDSGVVCWGANALGQTTVPSLTNPVAISLGNQHTCALDDSGVLCWGYNGYGQSTVPALSNPVNVYAGAYHTCALDDTGVVCWGRNDDAQVTVPALSNPVSVSLGTAHSCALDDSGVVCWGSNAQNQTTVSGLTNPITVNAGAQHTCAKDDNGVMCWGDDAQGQAAVPALTNPVAVSAGHFHTCALDDSGVVCWGNNGFGQITVPVLAFDKDQDGVQDVNDAFPLDLAESIDTDSDGIGNNADTDDDNDGIQDVSDAFPLDATESVDTDSDGVGDNSDNCVAISNADQADIDTDSIGDACEVPSVIDLDADDSSGSTGADFQTVFTEGLGAVVVVDMDLSITDTDSVNLSSVIITLGNDQAGDVLLETGDLPAGITVDASSTITERVLVGEASIADYVSAIKLIGFKNTSTTPAAVTRDINVSVVDEVGNTSNTATSSVSIIDDISAPIQSTNLGLTLNEGASILINSTMLSFTDDLQSASSITYTALFGSPFNGRLELTGNPAVEITSFTQDDIDNLRILYFHDSSETVSDSILFNVDDGRGNVVLTVNFDIAINLVDDNPPVQINNTGSSLNEGATDPIINNKLRFDDEQSASSVTYDITSEPNSGQLELTTSPGVEITSFTQTNIDLGQLVYVHDGSDTTIDIFFFDVNDGQGNSLVDNSFVLSITLVDDTVPVEVNNNGSSLNEGGTDIITDLELRFDDEQPVTNMLYILTTPPVNGQLELTTAPGVELNSFTQANLNSNKLVYVHSGSDTTTDSFAFNVDDGQGNVSTANTFNLTITSVDDTPPVQDINNGITVTQGESVFITGSVLKFSDTEQPVESITYTDISLLTGSHLALTSNPTGAINSFTQQDIDTNKIIYVHDGGLDTTDSITFNVNDGQGNITPGDFAITIEAADAEAPNQVNNIGSTVSEGGTDTISTAELRFDDNDQLASNVSFKLTSIPANGVLQLSGAPLAVNATFTQANIDANAVTYVHDATETTSDSFNFEVDDGLGNVNTGNTFYITVTPVDSEIPTVAFNVVSILNEGETDTITNLELRFDDEQPASSITYTSTSGPNSGQLELTTSSGVAITSFTQAHIDAGQVMYVHDDSETIVDGFNFDVNDGQGNASTGNSFAFAITLLDEPPVVDLDADNNSGALNLNFHTSFTEGTGAVSIADTDVLITDPENSQIISATVSLSPARSNDVLLLPEQVVLPDGITLEASTATLKKFTGPAASISSYAAAIKLVKFNNLSDDPNTTDRTVTVALEDSTTLINNPLAVTTISITAADNAPAIDLDADDSSTAVNDDFITTYVAGAASSSVAVADVDMVITDTDSNSLSLIEIRLTNSQPGDSLYVDGALPLAISIDGASSDSSNLILTGNASIADYLSTIAKVRFTNSGSTNNTARNITIQIQDDTFIFSDPATTTINISLAPVIYLNGYDPLDASNTGYQTGFIIGGADAVSIADADAEIRDGDSTNLVDVTITLINPTADDVLEVNNALLQGGIAKDANSTPTQIILTGSASLADYATSLAAVTFNNGATIPDTTPRLIQVVARDDTGNDGNKAETLISIGSNFAITTNDLPAIVLTDSDLTYSPTVTNVSDQSAADVAMTVVLPEDIFFMGVSGAGWDCNDFNVGQNTTVVCTRSQLLSGESASIDIEVNMSSVTKELTTNIVVSSASPGFGNGIATIKTLVVDFTTSGFENEIKINDPVAGPAGFAGSVVVDGDTMAVGIPEVNGGLVQIYQRSDTSWDLQDTLIIEGDSGDRFGHAVALQGNELAVSRLGTASGLDGQIFIFNHDGNGNWTQQQQLTSSATLAGDEFGYALSMSTNMMMVGAPLAGSGSVNDRDGAVRLFVKNGSSWSESVQSALSAGNVMSVPAGSRYGHAVALDNDRLAIGAPYNAALSEQGRVFVFRNNNGTIEFVEETSNLDSLANDRFGRALDIDGNTLVIGAEFSATGGLNTGAAHVYEYNASTWVYQQTLTNLEPIGNEQFGWSIDVQDETILIGSTGARTAKLDGTVINVGAAYVFQKSLGTWYLQQKVIPSDGYNVDQFGASVSISGGTIAVASPMDDDNALTDSGSLYVYRISNITDVKLSANDPVDDAAFGQTVAISGDTVVIGAPFANGAPGTEVTGAAYVYKRANNDNWPLQQILVPGIVEDGQQFGLSVAIEDEIIVVGAPYENDTGTDNGAVYVFQRNGSSWSENQRLVASDTETIDDRFGSAVGISANLLVIGAANDEAPVDSGSAYVFIYAGNSWTQQAKLQVTYTKLVDQNSFGSALDISGNNIVVQGGADAYVFNYDGQDWIEKFPRLHESSPITSVAIDGNTIVTGVSGDSNNTGAAFVYGLIGNSWLKLSKVEAIDEQAGSAFGSSVAILGDTMLVGAPGTDLLAANEGLAYVFSRNGLAWDQQKILTAFDAQEEDQFGGQIDQSIGTGGVAISSTAMVVGAPYEDSISFSGNFGSAYLYPTIAEISLPGGNYSTAKKVELSCDDCMAIYYTIDLSIPTTSSQLYTGSIELTATTTITYASQDSAGNLSTPFAENYVIDDLPPVVDSISFPADQEVVNSAPLSSISGIASDVGGAGLQQVQIEIKDIAANTYVDIDENGAFLGFTNTPTWLTTSGTDSWSLDTTNVNFESLKEYQIRARAFDQVGNASAITTSSFNYYTGDPAYMTLDLTLLSSSIVSGGKTDIALKLTQPTDLNTDLTGSLILLKITPPNTASDTTVTTVLVTTNEFGQVTLQNLGDANTEFNIISANGDIVSSAVSFDETGPYTLEASYNADTADYTRLPAYSSSGMLLVGQSAGYAVLIEGKLPDDSGLASHNKTSNRIYQSLLKRGFEDKNIYYFNYDPDQDNLLGGVSILDGSDDPVTGIDAMPTKDAITAVFNNEAVHNNTQGLAEKIYWSPAPVYVVMVDHGDDAENGYFVIADDTVTPGDETLTPAEKITPTELDSWMTMLKGHITAIADADPDTDEIAKSVRRIVAMDQTHIAILGMCYSGQFISSVSGPNRIIITSASASEQSYKGALESGLNPGDPDVRVGEFFMEELFERFERGDNIQDAFVYATDITEQYTGGAQHPLIDDNGSLQIKLANDLYFGIGENYIPESDANTPEVALTTPTLYLDDATTAALLSLESSKPASTSFAFVEIRKPTPGVITGLGGSEQLSVSYPKYILTEPVAGSARTDFSSLINEFDQPGKYEIFYFVQDLAINGGVISPMKRSVVYRDSVNNTDAPGEFNMESPSNNMLSLNDLTYSNTLVSLDWGSSDDADGFTYKVEVSTTADFKNIIFSKEEIKLSYLHIDKDNRWPDNTTLYWRVEAVDAYGVRTPSTDAYFRFDTKDGNFIVNAETLISGSITSSDGGSVDLAGAIVTVTAGGVSVPASIGLEGAAPYYLASLSGVNLSSGKVTVASSFNGFQSKAEDTDVTEHKNNPYPIVLDLEIADTDGDGLLDDEEDFNMNGLVDAGETDPSKVDTDGDGFVDGLDGVVLLTDYPAGIDVNGDGFVDTDLYPVVLTDGDLNGDGVVDIRDLLRAKRILTGQEPELDPNTELPYADVAPLGSNGKPAPDGQFNIGDLLILQRKVMGQISF